jgi:tetratricopeptide (TPR) repeat protein
LDGKNPGLEAGRASLARAYEHARAEKHKLAAETLFNQGLRREALAEITQAVTAEPRNANYQYLMGECLEAAGDYQGAHQAYLTCVLIDPENNKEAATRIRMMEQQGAVDASRTPQAANRIANNIAQQYTRQAPPLTTSQPQTVMSGTQAGAALSQPRTMPGATGTAPQSIINRTQNQPLATASQGGGQQGTATGATAADSAANNDGLARVTDAEAQRDYNTAIAILRELSSNNVQNPEIHHRLAINLLAAGQIDDSIAEFRISSALRPDKKIYSDDLARAMAIKKNGADTAQQYAIDDRSGWLDGSKQMSFYFQAPDLAEFPRRSYRRFLEETLGNLFSEISPVARASSRRVLKYLSSVATASATGNSKITRSTRATPRLLKQHAKQT